MDTLSQLANGFAVALTPVHLFWCLVGTTLGTAIGVLPGLGPALTIALLLPITYTVDYGDGAMEAIPLDDRLASAGAPRLLFHASAAPWLTAADKTKGNLVTDGPELYRTHAGTLLMLWSSYEKGSYVETLARSTTGEIGGPWEQLGPLVKQDSGHGMLFRRFDGQLMMVLHRPFEHARGKLYFMRDNGDRVSVIREATELDGETKSASEHSSKPA